MPMKKVILCSVVFFILNMLHISPIRAQDWQISQSTTLHTPFQTEAYAQKVRVFNNDYLVGITKVAGTEHYGFVLWKNNDIIKYIALLGTPDIIINDFTIYKEELFFCGQRLTSQGFYVGIIGYLNMNDFLSSMNFSYAYTDINSLGNLRRLVVRELPSNELMISAIGNDAFQLGTYGQVVHINLTNPLNSHFVSFPFFNQIYTDVAWDICFFDDYVVTLSHIHLNHEYVIRYFKYDGFYFLNSHNFSYTFPNINFNTSVNPEHDPMHLAEVGEDYVAVAISANDGQSDFSMINTHDKWSPNLLSSQLLYHENKNNLPLEMEYSPIIKRLLLLNNNYFNSLGKIQTMTYIDPFETNIYVTLMEYFKTPSEINHFSLISPNHYAVAGTCSFSQSNNLQLFATKNINTPFPGCLYNSLVKINQFPITSGVNSTFNNSPLLLNINWITDNISVNIENVSIDCVD